MLPPELQRLLYSTDPVERDGAWAMLVQSYSRLLLHTARSVIPDYDGAMDAYEHVLERLREDDFRRLRTYGDDGRSSFGTWLVVVARRLCIDHHRRRYGRAPRGEHDPAGAEYERAARRRLLDLAGLPVEAAEVVEGSPDTPDIELRVAELREALGAVLSQLGPVDRVLIKLRFEDGLSAPEIAAALHFPTPFHVYRRLNALLADLRRRLAARGVVSSAP